MSFGPFQAKLAGHAPTRFRPCRRPPECPEIASRSCPGESRSPASARRSGCLRQAPALSPPDRLIWTCLSRLWCGWKGALFLVQPATVVRWHREGFRRYWKRKSRRRPGRPRIDPEIRALIRRMASANPLWGVPRVHGELLKLGLDLSEITVSEKLLQGFDSVPRLIASSWVLGGQLQRRKGDR